MKLPVDMNLSPAWAPGLCAAGFDAAHWASVGSPTDSDHAIMEYARLHDAVVLTNDLDFSAILAATQARKPSVVQIRGDDLRFESIGTHVIRALSQIADELAEGALVSMDPSRTRFRVLPLTQER